MPGISWRGDNELFKIQVASLATPKSFRWALSVLGLDGQLFTGDQTERHNNQS